MDFNHLALKPNDTETFDEYKVRIYTLKSSGFISLTWEQIAELFSTYFDQHKHHSTWRKDAKNYNTQVNPELRDGISDLILEYKKERIKVSDERTQNNAIIRRISREETLKSIAKEVAKDIGKVKSLLPARLVETNSVFEHEAILQVSDWHYGIDIDNFWNKYNPDICKERVAALLDETLNFCSKYNIRLLHMVNLGDMISGRIHTIIRLQNRIDAMTQVMEISEILAEFISALTHEGIRVSYHDCIDNHSRMEPIKAESMEKESLCRIIPWYLKCRLASNALVTVGDNEYGDDIITFTVLSGKYKVGGVHGHKEKAAKLIEGLTLLTKTHYDLILSAHYHHFEAKEQNETLVVSNGSLMGTDDYSKDFKRQYMTNHQANLYVIGFACSKKDKIMSIRRDKRDFLENEFDLNL